LETKAWLSGSINSTRTSISLVSAGKKANRHGMQLEQRF
jgi:hypothetical protein